MAGNAAGVLKAAARRIGVSVGDYLARVQRREKWCIYCRGWHPLVAFPTDANRTDGRASSCRPARREHESQAYARSSSKRVRDPEKVRAQGLIASRVQRRVIPSPNALPCTDCDAIWAPGRARHEYDHHLGYSPEHKGDVEPVCARCHNRRERVRRGQDQHRVV